MGINAISSRFLLHARKHGVNFARTALLGRQAMYVDADTLYRNMTDLEFKASLHDAKLLVMAGYAEPFFQHIGAGEVTSFDCSDYEGATVGHDFNQPIGLRHYGKYSVVIDSGTLEHVFNFPQAIENCCRMIEEGGHFLGVMPANNVAGHGFYQFSPELLYRVFSKENGFRVEHMFIAEQGDDPPYPCASWRDAEDPEVVGRRVEFRTSLQTCLLVMAKKLFTKAVLFEHLQQSDYTTEWGKKR